MLTITCHSCDLTMSADDLEDLVVQGQDHALGHGHTSPPPREHVIARIRRQNPDAPADD